MKKLLTLFILSLLTGSAFTQVNHWETAVYSNTTWKYFVGTSEPPATWRQLSFNDASWLSGPGGIGFGDGDDGTTVALNPSVYLRKTFNVVNPAVVVQAMLSVDYDDGFIAYLNDVEIARSNLGAVVGDLPAYNVYANSQHEAPMYQGGGPENFTISGAALAGLLVTGNNVLSVTVHNATAGSSDISSNTWLHFGISDASMNYGPTPPWFTAPFESSNIPLIIIDSRGNTIADDPEIEADMGIIDNGPGNRNYLTDPFNNYNGQVSIEIRGASGQMWAKKSYGFETQDSLDQNFNAPLLGMPSENDWVLNATYQDKTLMHDPLTYEMMMRMGMYSPRYRYCELIINGDYKGVYILQEKIKIDKNRVSIEKLDADDLAGDSLTGGYIFKKDWGVELIGNGFYSSVDPNTPWYQFHDPNELELNPIQQNYLKGYLSTFETALLGPNFTDPNLGYRNYIDVPSYMGYMIANEASRNLDGYRASCFYSKQQDSYGGKIYALPLWDFNFAYGNVDFCNAWPTDGWAYDFMNYCGGGGDVHAFWWKRFLQDPYYQTTLRCTWDDLRTGFFHTDSIFSYLDSLKTLLDESRQRNFARWPIIGQDIYNYYLCNSWDCEFDTMKWWIAERFNWLDANWPAATGPCNPSPQQVVLSEINYNSPPADNAGDWVELWNTSATTVDLSRWVLKDANYFHTFDIPVGTQLQPGERIVLCQDTTLFRNVHPGANPILGKFNWNLDDNTERVWLRDEYFNDRFSVVYHDQTPWPPQADGLGYTLELLDPSQNLNNGSNWFFGCPNGSPTTPYVPSCWIASNDNPTMGQNWMIVPNPFQDDFSVVAISPKALNGNITLTITDLSGKVHYNKVLNAANEIRVTPGELTSGVYIIELKNENNDVTRMRVVKTW